MYAKLVTYYGCCNGMVLKHTLTTYVYVFDFLAACN